jgi:hypothetical protein
VLKRPGLAFFGSQLWQLSHRHPEGQVRTDPLKRVNGKKSPHPRRGSRDRSATSRRPHPGDRSALWALPGSARGVRGYAGGRARASEGALSEGTCAGARAGSGRGWREGRAGAGPRRRADAELAWALRGCGSASSGRAVATVPRTSAPELRDTERLQERSLAWGERPSRTAGSLADSAALDSVEDVVGAAWGRPRRPGAYPPVLGDPGRGGSARLSL